MLKCLRIRIVNVNCEVSAWCPSPLIATLINLLLPSASLLLYWTFTSSNDLLGTRKIECRRNVAPGHMT